MHKELNSTIYIMKKRIQPENFTLSSQTAQSPPDAAIPAASGLSSALVSPTAAMPFPDTTEGVAAPAHRVGNWRDHISFWFGIVGAVIGIISFAVSVYFYQASQIKPQLTFGVHPLKTELQRPDFDKELGFIYKGKPLDSESITSVQVSIWNAGTRSIRDSDVLDPFRLVMPDGSAILSVRAKKTSRPICGFESLGNQEDYKSGICRLKWRILEPGDGAVVQIIYAGSARRDPTLEGTVEGQRDGTVVEGYTLNLSGTAIEDSISIRMSRHWPIIVLLLIGLFLLFIAGRSYTKTEAVKKWAQERAAAAKLLAEVQKKSVPAPPLLWVLFVAGLVCILGAVVLLLIYNSRPGPPFGW